MNNVYTRFKGLDYEQNEDGGLIIRSYQIVPKYWLSTNDEHRLLILNWTVGAGKTIGGLLTVLRSIKAKRMSELNKMFISSTIDIPKVIIIGEWVTQSQIQNELCRREFTLLSDNEWIRIDNLIKSKREKDRKEGEELMNGYVRGLKKYITFLGYQSLVNNLFPSYSKSGTQDIANFVNDYENGKLKVNNSFIENIKNTTIIVDEMQRLYSRNGMNTYGFSMSYLVKHASELNIKVVYLTGTLLNSSVVELSEVVNLSIIDRKEFIQRSDYFVEKGGDDSTMSHWEFNSNGNKLIESLRPVFLYYSRITRSLSYEQIDGDAPIVLKSKGIDEKTYPIEYLMGNEEIGSDFTVYTLIAKGKQSKSLDNMEFDIDDEDRTNSISPYDAVIPKNTLLDKSGIYRGTFLDRKSIGQYSIIGEFIIDECIRNAKNREKSVLYHFRVKSFGLLQYLTILEYNGFTRYGKEPVENSICSNCWKRFSEHKSINKSCPKFKPLIVAGLYGEMTSKERHYIVENVYNSPSNLYGDLISVLLISDVAYVGVSLLATNNMYILSPVSNMSKLKQIQARVNRFKSHIALPIDKRFVRQFVLGVRTNKTERIVKYYRTRYEANELINKTIDNMKKGSIGSLLLETPEKISVTREENKIANTLLFEDTVDSLRSITTKIQLNSKSNIWSDDLLIKRIKDPKFALTFINLENIPNEFIKQAIRQSPFTEFYESKRLNITFVKNRTLTDITSTIHYPIVEFDQIEIDHIGMVNDLIRMFPKVDEYRKYTIIRKILNILINIDDFSPLVKWEGYWQWSYLNGNEYYDDDEENYLLNHTAEMRSYEKVTGTFIPSNRILMKNGTVKQIHFSFSPPAMYRNTNIVYKIEMRMGFNHLVAYKYSEFVEMGDGFDNRKRSRGQGCGVGPTGELFSRSTYATFYDCVSRIEELCAEQLKSKNENGTFLFTPFQR